ncbi:MAG TPA: 50S ribosomal protein L23 [Acidobacteriota bacterium]|nr:50S ribosomal protein L23 [Acidobacteriota bacterium]
MRVHDILRYPHITEKSTLLREKVGERMLAFQVRRSANKHQIKVAVETAFGVEVEKVRTANFQGKIRRQGRFAGRKPAWKKAYVTLKPGQKTIEFFETA